MNLFLQLKVSIENNSKTTIDLSSFKLQFLCHCYNTRAETWRDGSQLSYVFDLTYGLAKNQYSFKYGFQKFVVLLIDSVLRVFILGVGSQYTKYCI